MDGIEWIFSISVLIGISSVQSISAVIQMLRQNKLWPCTIHAVYVFFSSLEACCILLSHFGLAFHPAYAVGEK